MIGHISSSVDVVSTEALMRDAACISSEKMWFIGFCHIDLYHLIVLKSMKYKTILINILQLSCIIGDDVIL